MSIVGYLSKFFNHSDSILSGLRFLTFTGSGADRIVGAKRPGVRRGDAGYVAMT